MTAGMRRPITTTSVACVVLASRVIETHRVAAIGIAVAVMRRCKVGELSALLQEIVKMVETFTCPACGGSGMYRQKWSKMYPDGYETMCRKCEGQGLHPTATAIIERIKNSR